LEVKMSWLFLVLFWASAGAFVFTYGGYPILVKFFSRIFAKPLVQNKDYECTLAIVVPAYNEEEVIREKIENILSLDYPREKMNIWIASDCSTDQTEKIVEEYKEKGVRLWKAPSRMGKSQVLNRVIPMTDGEIAVVTDADIMMEKESLRKIVRNFGDPSVGCVGGNTRYGKGPEARAEERVYRFYERKLKEWESMLHSSVAVFGSFYAVRRELFKTLPDKALANDDILIPMNIIRKGCRVYFESEALSYEKPASRVKGEFLRRIRIGTSNLQAFFWLLDFLNPLKGWAWFCFVGHKVLRWFSPFFLAAGWLSTFFLGWIYGLMLSKVLFLAGVVVFVVAVSSFVIPLRCSRYVMYFLAMNIALILGAVKFLCGIRRSFWSPPERGKQ